MLEHILKTHAKPSSESPAAEVPKDTFLAVNPLGIPVPASRSTPAAVPVEKTNSETSRVYLTGCRPACHHCGGYITVEKTFGDDSVVESCLTCGTVINDLVVIWSAKTEGNNQ